MKRILCQRVSVPSLCKPARDGKETGEDELSQSTNTPKWSQAFEIFRTQHEDLSDEERAVLWKKTRNAMIQEDEVQMRLYAELDLIYGSDDDVDGIECCDKANVELCICDLCSFVVWRALITAVPFFK